MSEAADRRPVCAGTGLVVLDAIYGGGRADPDFLAGGSCGNVMTMLAYLGWDSYPIARLGDDSEGRRIVGDMKAWGVRTGFLSAEAGVETPRIIEQITGGTPSTHRFRLKCSHGNWLPQRRPYTLKLARSVPDEIPRPDVFYFDRPDPAALSMARRFKARGAVVFFEPHRPADSANFAECVAVSDIVKHCYDRPLNLERPEIPPLEVQTMGDRGLRYRTRARESASWRTLPAFPADRLTDAAGAGDWLSAGLIHKLFRKGPRPIPARGRIEPALRFGAALASINCNFAGARGAMYSMAKPALMDLASRVARSPRRAVHFDAAARPAYRAKPECRVCTCQ